MTKQAQPPQYYKVVFTDDCKNTKEKEVAKRIEKLLKEAAASDVLKKKEKVKENGFRVGAFKSGRENLFKEIDSTGNADKLEEWIKKVEQCTSYEEVQALDKNLAQENHKHDLWLHIHSDYSGRRDVTLWEFKLYDHGRVFCYVEHSPSKTVFVIDGAFTSSENHKNFNYPALCKMGEDILDATVDKGAFTKIRKEIEIEELAGLAVEKTEYSDQAIQDEDVFYDSIGELKELSDIESCDEADEFFYGFGEYLKKLNDTNPKVFTRLHKALTDEANSRFGKETSKTNYGLSKVSTTTLKRCLNQMQALVNNKQIVLALNEKQAV